MKETTKQLKNKRVNLKIEISKKQKELRELSNLIAVREFRKRNIKKILW